MRECNSQLIPILKKIFDDKVLEFTFEKALEVACGEAFVTFDLLAKRFKEVHLFDQCSHAINNIVKPK